MIQNTTISFVDELVVPVNFDVIAIMTKAA
jgi:hypothetical protein